jgi:hypothetical protein
MPLLTSGLGGRWGSLGVHRLYRGTTLLIAGIRNLAFNPPAVSGAGVWSAATATGSHQLGTLGPCTTFYRAVKTAATTGAVQTRTAAYVPSATYTLIVTLRASAATQIQVTLNPTFTNTTGAVTAGANVTLAAGVAQTVTRTFTAPSTAPSATPGVRFRDITGPLPIGATLDVTGLVVIAGSVAPGYRDAASPGWFPEGALHDSPSRGWS